MLMEGGADFAAHVLSAGDLDLTDFLTIAGTRFDAGSAALTKTCDKVCGRMGKLLTAVGGAARVIREGFKGSVRGGAATYDKLDKACDEYGAAKRKLAGLQAGKKMYTGKKTFVSKRDPSHEKFKQDLVDAETKYVLAQKKIIEALGGSLVTASVQKDAKREANNEVDGEYVPHASEGRDSGGGGSSDRSSTPSERGGSSSGSSIGKTVLLVALAAGTVFAFTRG
jgi:hypothetical protein